MDRCKQKQRGLRGYYVAGPPLLSGRCTSLLRDPHLRNDLYCVEWDVKPYYIIPYPVYSTPFYRTVPYILLSVLFWSRGQNRTRVNFIFGGNSPHLAPYNSGPFQICPATIRLILPRGRQRVAKRPTVHKCDHVLQIAVR